MRGGKRSVTVTELGVGGLSLNGEEGRKRDAAMAIPLSRNATVTQNKAEASHVPRVMKIELGSYMSRIIGFCDAT